MENDFLSQIETGEQEKFENEKMTTSKLGETRV